MDAAAGGHARFGTTLATQPVEVRHDLAVDSGFWAVVADFEGALTAVRFAKVDRDAPPAAHVPWAPLRRQWCSSLDHAAYLRGVAEIRRRIAAGTVYQVNLCRVVSHDLPDEADLDGLEQLLARGNPAPYSGRVHVPGAAIDVVSASPEAFLVRDGDVVESRPIKGTATTLEGMLPKDYAENVMIVDLVRNDLSHVCRPGTVRVDHLCEAQSHPGLVHLVSTVTGRLRAGASWPELMGATFPPGSVSGTPKHTALQAIGDLEPVARGPYCGAVGWVDADRGTARLAVGIRSFWADRDETGRRVLRFGTGAGITWGSDPQGEWEETQVKAARLIGLASGRLEP
ncbi:chorismate-binding protein [Pedococcus sp. 5OH_020]|uniref:chorismate-binding protein n=1 Tax=Pedococcus sp. 5OH_020 TaxID=2989814 RepID=UPI0022E9D313|nr:chorismate-binding protein [Pedococcus sp. 5OH_020]